MNVFQAIVIAIIEGITEFLPISSTAHMKFANPILGIASLFGFDPVGSLMANMPKGTGTTTKTAWQPGDDKLSRDDGQGQAPKNVIQAGIEKFQPTDQQTAQMDEIRRKMMIYQNLKI